MSEAKKKKLTTAQKEEYSFRGTIKSVMTIGQESSPRGLLIKEVNNFWYTLPPFVRFMNFKDRKLNIDYIKHEFLWYLKGDRLDTSITDHAKMWKGLINEDGSINSNYGQYLFGDQQQFWNVVKLLEDDRESRRGSISILNKDHLLSDTKDVPCTYAINFRIRQNKLDMTVHMRSQDAIFGMGNDAPTFSFVHEMMWQALREKYPSLEYGLYCHFADSFHIYERHFEMAEKIIEGGKVKHVKCPKISGRAEVAFLTGTTGLQLSDIPEEFAFTKWLYTYEK